MFEWIVSRMFPECFTNPSHDREQFWAERGRKRCWTGEIRTFCETEWRDRSPPPPRPKGRPGKSVGRSRKVAGSRRKSLGGKRKSRVDLSKSLRGPKGGALSAAPGQLNWHSTLRNQCQIGTNRTSRTTGTTQKSF